MRQILSSYPAPIEQVMTPFDQALLRTRRHRLMQQARGRVLELGGGGGVNLEHYPAAEVSHVVVTGAEGPSRSRLQRTNEPGGRAGHVGDELLARQEGDPVHRPGGAREEQPARRVTGGKDRVGSMEDCRHGAG